MRNSPIHLAATMVKLMILWAMWSQTNEIMIRRQSEQINQPISHRFEAEFAKLAMEKHITLQISKKSYLREKSLVPVYKTLAYFKDENYQRWSEEEWLFIIDQNNCTTQHFIFEKILAKTSDRQLTNYGNGTESDKISTFLELIIPNSSSISKSLKNVSY